MLRIYCYSNHGRRLITRYDRGQWRSALKSTRALYGPENIRAYAWNTQSRRWRRLRTKAIAN